MVISSSPLSFTPTLNKTFSNSASDQSASKTSISSEQEAASSNSNSPKNGENLQQEAAQQVQLQKLRNIDREVRAHEMAHLSAAGRYASSGANFNYQKGPDGRLYAVSGEVSIDTSVIPGDPRATLLKAQTLIRAAMAPASPSSQDRQVAAQATAMAQQARIELASPEQAVGPAEPGNNLDIFA